MNALPFDRASARKARSTKGFTRPASFRTPWASLRAFSAAACLAAEQSMGMVRARAWCTVRLTRFDIAVAVR